MSNNKVSNIFQWVGNPSDTGRLAFTALLFSPAVCLIGFWIGGELALTLLAIILPSSAAGLIFLNGPPSQQPSAQNHYNALGPEAFEETVKTTMDAARRSGLKSAVFHLRVDEYDTLIEHHGDGAMDSVALQIRDRIRSTLRADDTLAIMDPSTFSISISPQAMFDLEACLELAGRLNRAIAEPYSIDGTTIYVTSSLGFCQLGRETSNDCPAHQDPVSDCAKTALQAALHAAPGAIRAYTADTPKISKTDTHQDLDVVEGLENGEIVPWYQPQISTDTGKITGFEALARWMHHSRGPISPAEFLPLLEKKGLMGRLSEVMLYHAMTAIKAWDQAGIDVRQVGVNFSPAELNDPKLVEKITWELDRFELAPERLAVEILETVVAKGPDDVVTRNIKGLSTLGCHIDLDDFGTGHASLASIRRFGVGRIKIDRSFVMKSDRDQEQQRMIRAILTLAEKLDIETLAEGVETVGEHSLLAQLGCTHVQGFGIGRPMPFEQTLTWIREHNAKLQEPPNIGRAMG